MKTLILPLKGVYFDEIKRGEKTEEYRLVTDYRRKRLEGRSYDQIILTKGYPARDAVERRLRRPWCGFRKTTITHEYFGPNPVEVFAIKVN